MTLVLLALLASPTAQDEADQDPVRTLKIAEREERKVLAELSEVEQQLYEVEREIEELQVRIDEVEQQRMLNEDELLRSQASLDERGQRIGGLIEALYKVNRRGFARIVFSAEDPSDLRRRTRYLLALLSETETVISRFSDQVELKKASVARVDTDRAALAALQAEIRLKEARLRDERARRLSILEEVRSDKVLALQVLRERDGNDAFQDPGPTVGGPTYEESFQSLGGKLRWPVNGQLLRGFGKYTDAATGVETRNQGLDILAPKHTPVRSVAAGTVLRSGWVNGYGMTVILDHGEDFRTVYAHLGTSKVRQGQQVSKGAIVGTVGETGVTDDRGPRLHFEVRRRDSAQNPTNWLGPKP
jgi:septal ring factor EnvC (AmiA/AmiB activator)